jgi:hypothetical protein
MSDEFHFDPSQEEGSSFKPISVGNYTAEIIEATLAVPSNGDGHMLKLVWRVIDSAHEGRQVFDYLCYQHSNQQTQDIARRKIKDICTALGITEQVTNPEVFMFKPMQVRIGIKSDKQGLWDDQNVVSRVRPLNAPDAPAPAPSSPTPPRPATPAAAATKPTSGLGAAPWKKPAA